MATERVKQVFNQITGNSRIEKLASKSDDDVVITMAFRTPLCKSRKGGYKDMRSDELLTAVYKAAISTMSIDPALVEDIVVGTCLSPVASYEARACALAAGFPDTTTTEVVNRFCSSGLMATTVIANSIRNGDIDIGMAVGFESMTANQDKGVGQMSDEIMAHPAAKDCVQPMGWTSENVAGDFNIPRDRMDEFAYISHSRASEAQRNGKFKDEIVPIEVFVTDAPGSKTRTKVIISEDDGIRHGTTKEALLKIRPAFPQYPPGQTTGGNASQITDGGAAVLLMKRRKAKELGLRILAKHIMTTTAGLPAAIMGIGPSFAIPKLLEKTGLRIEDIDLFEINEAFASMYVYCVEKLGLDINKVNVNGGAIALGHPLGCTGARQIATGLSELRKRQGRVLVTSMCIGTGMGAAAAFILE